MNKKRIFLLLGSILLALVLVMLPLMSSCAPEEEVEEVEEEAEIPVIKVVHITDSPPTQSGEIAFEELMEKWDKACRPLGYQIVLEPHYSGEMYPGEQNIDALSTGSVQSGGTLRYREEGFEPRFGIFSIPCLWSSHEHIVRFFNTPEWQKVLADHEEAGVKLLSYSDFYMYFYFAEKEVRCLEDIAGMRLRCMESPVMVRAIELLGANPIAIASGELTVAMQTGMMDGLIGALGPGYMKYLGYLDYMKTVLEFPITYTVAGNGVNAEWWYSLPEEVRQALEELLPDYFEERHAIQVADTAEGIAMIREAATITTLTKAEVARWIETLEPLLDEVGDKIGYDLIDAALRTRD